MLDDKLVKKFLKITYPSITYCKKIYINRVYPTINLELVQKEIQDNTLNMIGGNPLVDPKYSDKEEENIIALHELKLQNKNYDIICRKNPGGVKIRILANKVPPWPEIRKKNLHYSIAISDLSTEPKKSPKKTPKNNDTIPNTSFGCGVFNMCSPSTATRTIETLDSTFEGIVIHIHGGGFVAMSSGSHQSYTRQ